MNKRQHKFIVKIIEIVSVLVAYVLQIIKYCYKQAYVSKFENLDYLRKTQSMKTHIRKIQIIPTNPHYFF